MSWYSALLIEWSDDTDGERILDITRAVGERMKENVSEIQQVSYDVPEFAKKAARAE